MQLVWFSIPKHQRNTTTTTPARDGAFCIKREAVGDNTPRHMPQHPNIPGSEDSTVHSSTEDENSAFYDQITFAPTVQLFIKCLLKGTTSQKKQQKDTSHLTHLQIFIESLITDDKSRKRVVT